MQALPTVFIVDADEFAGEALKLLMRSAGWLVEVFESAGEFMSQPRAMNPGCLIVGIDGLELQQALVDRPEMPTIFVTSHCDISIAVRAMKAGAVETKNNLSPPDPAFFPRSFASPSRLRA